MRHPVPHIERFAHLLLFEIHASIYYENGSIPIGGPISIKAGNEIPVQVALDVVCRMVLLEVRIGR
jgi:hypothetical protein